MVLLRLRPFRRRGALLATGALLGLLRADSSDAQSARPWVDPPAAGETQVPEVVPVPAPGTGAAEPRARNTSPPTSIDTRRPDLPPSPAEAAPAQRAPSTPAPSRIERAAPPSQVVPDAVPERRDVSPAPRTNDPFRSAEPPRPTAERDAQGAAKPRTRGSEQAAAAEELATAYLDYWSAPNAITLEATPEFYAPQVLFHGRQMNARALFEEKRRFVRRWPVREYHPRLDTMHTTCDAAPPICTVRTMFDFTATSPQTGKVSQGTALLQLGVSFSAGRPMIIIESSRVTSRARGPISEVFEDDEAPQ